MLRVVLVKRLDSKVDPSVLTPIIDFWSVPTRQEFPCTTRTLSALTSSEALLALGMRSEIKLVLPSSLFKSLTGAVTFSGTSRRTLQKTMCTFTDLVKIDSRDLTRLHFMTFNIPSWTLWYLAVAPPYTFVRTLSPWLFSRWDKVITLVRINLVISWSPEKGEPKMVMFSLRVVLWLIRPMLT